MSYNLGIHFISNFLNTFVKPHVDKDERLRNTYEAEMQGWPLDQVPQYRRLRIREEVLVFVRMEVGTEPPIPDEIRQVLGDSYNTIEECVAHIGGLELSEYSFVYQYDFVSRVSRNINWRYGRLYKNDCLSFYEPACAIEARFSDVCFVGNNFFEVSPGAVEHGGEVMVTERLYIHRGRFQHLVYNLGYFYVCWLQSLDVDLYAISCSAGLIKSTSDAYALLNSRSAIRTG